jgi:hypothetical protein
LLVERGIIARTRGEASTEKADAKQVLVLIEPLVKFLGPVIYLFHPDGGGWNRIYFLLVIFWTLFTWALFGAAITRMAAVQLARGDKIGMTEAVRFAWSRYMAFFCAPLFPLGLIALLTIFLWLYGLFGVLTFFIGDIFIYGLLWPLVILFGLVMAVVLVGLVGWPLMYATISTEGSDSFDALSRTYSYVYQAPWHYLWYSFLAVAYGAVVVFFVGLMGSLMIYLGKWAVNQAPSKFVGREPAYLFVYTPTSFGWRELLLEGSPAVYSEEEVRKAYYTEADIRKALYTEEEVRKAFYSEADIRKVGSRAYLKKLQEYLKEDKKPERIDVLIEEDKKIKKSEVKKNATDLTAAERKDIKEGKFKPGGFKSSNPKSVREDFQQGNLKVGGFKSSNPKSVREDYEKGDLKVGGFKSSNPDTVIADYESENLKKGNIKQSYRNEGSFWNRNVIGSLLVAFWVGLIFLLVVGFGYSYFWTASVMIYLLMRKKVDDTELDEVHVEEEDLEEPYMPPPTTAPPPPSQPATPGLIPPESLTLRTAPPTTQPSTPPQAPKVTQLAPAEPEPPPLVPMPQPPEPPAPPSAATPSAEGAGIPPSQSEPQSPPGAESGGIPPPTPPSGEGPHGDGSPPAGTT